MYLYEKPIELKGTILQREAKITYNLKQLKGPPGSKHVLDALAHDLTKTGGVVFQDFLDPL